MFGDLEGRYSIHEVAVFGTINAVFPLTSPSTSAFEAFEERIARSRSPRSRTLVELLGRGRMDEVEREVANVQRQE